MLQISPSEIYLPSEKKHVTMRSFSAAAWQSCLAKLALLGILGLGFGAAPASAQLAVNRSSTPEITAAPQTGSNASKTVNALLTQKKVVKRNGVEYLEDASVVGPGEVIEYKVTYSNVSPADVTNLIAELPIPAGLEYVPNSTRSSVKATVTASAADGVFAAEPLMQVVNGKRIALPYNAYRMFHWNIGRLKTRETVTVSARAMVETNTPKKPN